RIKLLYWDLMGVKMRSGCGNQSQAAGAAEEGVKAALQSRQYAICSWVEDDRACLDRALIFEKTLF
ncbi:hypothetical protein LZT28_23140, partial [Aeromonas media]